MPGQLFVISAPSGAGKSTLLKAVREKMEGLDYSISHTTRKQRKTERDGVDYHFVDRKTFQQMIDAGAFVEWAKIYHEFYGTSFSSLDELMTLGRDILLDLDAQGAKNIKDHFGKGKSALIFVLPPSLEALESRLRGRGTDDESVIRARLGKAAHEIKDCFWYDYVLINEDLQRATGELQSIIISERCRAERRRIEVQRIFNI